MSAKRTTSFTDIHQEVFNTVSFSYKAYNPADIANEALFADTLLARDFNWIAVPGITEPMEVTARARYNQKEQPATVYPEENGLVKVKFREPPRARTPGQAVVLYPGDLVLGGGTIDRIL